jgi:hypothetical protein
VAPASSLCHTSQRPVPLVSSALPGLTSEFGMGSGVAPAGGYQLSAISGQLKVGGALLSRPTGPFPSCGPMVKKPGLDRETNLRLLFGSI